MTFGLDSSGLEIKRAADIKTELEASFRATFGQAINLDARSVLGQIIGIVSEREALVWELIEEIYLSQYPDTSEGTSLDNVAAITGTTRKAATKSTGIATLIGDAGTIVSQGSIVSVSGDEDARFVTDTTVEIAAGTDEVQTIAFLQPPEGGNWRLVFNGEVTANLDETTTATDLKSALEALPSIDQVNVAGNFSTGFTVTFKGQNELSPQPPISVDLNTLTATEKGTIDTVADSSGSLDGTGFLAQEVGGSVAFWIDVDNSGTAIPGWAAAADRAVEITTIATNDDANTVATKVAAAMLADAAFSSASATLSQITWEAASAGALVDIADTDTGFTIAVTTQGRSAGELTITVTETTPGVFPQVDVGVTAETAGEVQAPAGTLTVIETPVSGWDSVTNALDIDVGTDIESDQALKLRRLSEIAIAGKATLEAIRAAVLALTDVTAVVIFENNSSLEDADGRPPHSVDIVVENGDDATIAQTIFDTVAAGIETIGDITELVQDSQGFDQQIKFSRPDEVLIYLEVDLTVDTDLFPADGEDQVQALLVAFGNAIGIGSDVIVFPQLVCSFADVPGILDIAIKIASAPIPVDGSATVTASDDAGDLLWTSAAHGLVDNNKVVFSTTGTLPTGIAPNVVYHVVEADTNDFKVATERGGTPIVFADAGTGTHTVSFGGRDDNIEIGPREVAKFDTSRTTVAVV